MFERYDKQIPDYYPTMYLDGYTPAQILHAAKRGMYQQHMERKREQSVERDVQSALEAAMKDLFQDWK